MKARVQVTTTADGGATLPPSIDARWTGSSDAPDLRLRGMNAAATRTVVRASSPGPVSTREGSFVACARNDYTYLSDDAATGSWIVVFTVRRRGRVVFRTSTPTTDFIKATDDEPAVDDTERIEVRGSYRRHQGDVVSTSAAITLSGSYQQFHERVHATPGPCLTSVPIG